MQPILAERCVGCHGPAKQENGYRLDRRSTAFSGVLRPSIIAGSSASSPLYHRLVGNQRGRQMPLDGALPTEQIEIIRRWIDEGAVWPESLADESAAGPDATGVRIADAIRRGQRDAVRAELRRNPATVDARGAAGATPLMFAALYGDRQLVADLLKLGADINARSDAGATPLMWAIEHLDIVRQLLDAGADVHAAALFEPRTALRLAAMIAGGGRLVELLLARGAKPDQGVLTTAALHGQTDVTRLLLARGLRDN